jgi:hypothetical protein
MGSLSVATPGIVARGKRAACRRDAGGAGCYGKQPEYTRIDLRRATVEGAYIDAANVRLVNVMRPGNVA